MAAIGRKLFLHSLASLAAGCVLMSSALPKQSRGTPWVRQQAVSLFQQVAGARPAPQDHDNDDREHENRESKLRARLAQVATALSAGNPADALEPFSKSCVGYEKLRDYFQGLTNSFNVMNEAEVMSETDNATESKLTVNWSITLNGKEDEPGYQRSASLQIRFVREKNKWKIVELTPVSFFDPTAQ